jgi:hypothetical protein
MHLPPSGDPVNVFLVFKNEEGKLVERPISDFVIRSDQDSDEFDGVDADDAKEKPKFPNTFLFAGSLMHDSGSGKRRYLSDSSGNVISISTFGDEVLCLPLVHASDNGSLMWRIDATDLPKVGSKVTLRLRPKIKPAPTTRPKSRK